MRRSLAPMRQSAALVLLVLLAACVKKPPAAIKALQGSGWTVTQLDELITVERTSCSDDDLATLAEHGECLKRISVKIPGTAITNAGVRKLDDLDNIEALDASNTAITLDAVVGLEEIVTLVLSKTPATDLGLRHLSGMTRLNSLKLDDCAAINGSGLHHLAGLSALESLYLRRTTVNDAGLKKLPPLAMLRRVFLDETMLTDAALPYLLTLPALDEVGLEGVAGLTPTALDNFEEANEEIQVNR